MKKQIKIDLYIRIRAILESARATIARSVNSTQVIANWLIGREIVVEEQEGNPRARYGAQLLMDLSAKLQKEFGCGYSVNNLEHFRSFFLTYPDLMENKISHAVRGIFNNDSDTGIRKAPIEQSAALPRKSKRSSMASTADSRAWKTGTISPDLSWTHYRTLLRIERKEARNFYEIEAIKNNWSARQLERQVNSLLFERLLKSRDKKGVLALANKGQVVSKPIDVIKDPYVLEFLDLPESHRLVETKLETALISKLKDFLLELGSGFAFVERQKRLTLEGDHFYPDLIFYHIKLKCYVIIELKTQKLNHGDLGQMQMYVHYYDREIKSKDENPTIGLILCTDKNDLVVKYVLDKKQRRIFTSRYQFHLPTEEELRQELRREMEMLALPEPAKKIRKPVRRSK